MERIAEICTNAGLTNARPIDTECIQFLPELRKSCESNYCGSYGTNWMCPPAVPDVGEMMRRIREYPQGLVLQYVGHIEDSYDFDGMTRCGERFKQIMENVRVALTAETTLKDLWLLAAGGCHICAKCAYVSGEPCVNPGKPLYSLEACGIYVNDMISKAGLMYNNGENTISYAGMALFRQLEAE